MTRGKRPQHGQAENREGTEKRRFAGRTDKARLGCSRHGGANRNVSLLFDSFGLALFLGLRFRLVMAVVEAVGLVGRRRAVAARWLGQGGATRLVQEARPFGGLFPGESAAQAHETRPQSTTL